MKVKVFDENHEKDLEETINKFLKDFDGDLIDIKFQTSVGIMGKNKYIVFQH